MLVHPSLCYVFSFYVKNVHHDFEKLKELKLSYSLLQNADVVDWL